MSVELKIPEMVSRQRSMSVLPMTYNTNRPTFIRQRTQSMSNYNYNKNINETINTHDAEQHISGTTLIQEKDVNDKWLFNS